MSTELKNSEWERLSYNEKNHELYLRQKILLATFREHNAITQEQYEKSLCDLTEKMHLD